MSLDKTGQTKKQSYSEPSQSTKLFLTAVVHGTLFILVCCIIAGAVMAS